MTKKTALQMKDQTFNEKYPESIIAFLQDIKANCDACKIHESAADWLIKQYPNALVESVIETCGVLPTETP